MAAKTKKTMVGSIDPAVLSYTAGNDAVLDHDLVEVDCIGSAAHATMLTALKMDPSLFSKSELNDIIAELRDIIKQSRSGKFKISVADQDVHLAVERVLTSRLGDPGRRIHTARSRNDQIALDLRLYGKEQLLGTMDDMIALINELLKFGKSYNLCPMVGRTHMQPGMPSSVGLWATAYAESLMDDMIVLRAAYDQNNRSPLGSAAGYGVPLDIDRELTSRLLGFREPVHNVLYASNARGKCESVILSAMAQIMITLSRFAEDLIIYSMPEFAYFELPKAFCTGSSIMPQKSNPDVLELVRGRSSIVMSHAQSAMLVLKGLHGGYNRDLQEIKEPYLAGIKITRSSLQILSAMVAEVKVNRDALVDGFRPEVYAADRALELVSQGMPFRIAYDHVKEHLEELETLDADEAVAAKAHLGATAGLDFKLLKAKTSELKKFARSERSRYYSAISKLLGVKYPSMD